MRIAALVFGGFNAAVFLLTAYDKFAAKHLPGWRVPERLLLWLAALGGAAGEWLAMLLFKHKTRKPRFSVGVPAFLVIQVALIALLRMLDILPAML